MSKANTKPFFVSIPHSGERVPDETPWLKTLPETVLMFDVDRYVDQLYVPGLTQANIPFVKTDWHRYAIDLNRLPDDVDSDSVIGHKNASGSFPRGLHWSMTTTKEKLMPGPMTQELHERLIKLYFEPFHSEVRLRYEEFRKAGFKNIYHLDAHSMPSRGTSEHRDPGEFRKDVVISDCKGSSCSETYLDLVTTAYRDAGFTINYNWPYFGGRVTETYGHPNQGQQAIQVELNRSLYMDEKTKRLIPEKASSVKTAISEALKTILDGIDGI